MNQATGATASPSKKERILARLGRLTVTGAITFGIGVLTIFDRYNNYWDTTIFRVQTVDFNILSHTLPTKLSQAIVQNKPEELQRTLNSNYGLFGLVVTDPTGQKVIASSQSYKTPSWASALNPEQLQKHPYDVLLNPPPTYPQWSYSSPYATDRSATNLTNQGRVIGRVYYVRGVKPSFRADFVKWLSNPITPSSRIETYTMTMVAWLTGGFAVWLLWEYLLYKKFVQQQQAREKEKALIEQNETLSFLLIERVFEIENLQYQLEEERFQFNNQSQELHTYNQQLQQQISQLHNTIAVLPKTVATTTHLELEQLLV
ncbi:MAG: hypothetical protein SAK29_14780 [Scytonema sp. PMC 1069.18]|nr:hypothetical protein [Scytonema sp. PMC 1069.18]MEC4886865.1 hypothetical protein [Scytonema sp. PMC 1070.18]